MSVVIETTVGDITVDLFLLERPRACLNFLKLCKIRYYNFNLFHTISRGFIAQTGDPTGSRTGGQSVYGILDGSDKKFFSGEKEPRIKHTKMGLISFVGDENSMIGSQFFFTLGEDLTYLDPKHCVFGEIVEGFEVLEVINESICDTDDRPYQDVRITHTVILDDPFPDPKQLIVPSRSPSPTPERLQGGRIAPDEEIDEMEGKNAAEVAEMQADREAKARATILEMVGDIPDAEMAPPENVLFVCKLNPVTTDDDLEIIFNRFGKIKSCEVIRDKKTGDSLQYAFIEFEDQKSCEDAYFKMDNILIDDRRIHVDFSQSVSKIKWHGKGRGVTYINSNKSDKYSEYDFSGKARRLKDGDMNNSKKYRTNSGNYHKNEKNYSNIERKSQREYSDYRNKVDKYKQFSRDERRRRSKSVSPDRRTVRRQRSRSLDKKYEKNRSITYSKGQKYSRDYYKETKRYDANDEEKNKHKQNKLSSKNNRKQNEVKRHQVKNDFTDSENEGKKMKKREQSVSESDSNEKKRTKRSHSNDRNVDKRTKSKDKKKQKSQKVKKRHSSSSSSESSSSDSSSSDSSSSSSDSSSDSSESDYKSREKNKSAKYKKGSEKKYRQDSSDGEAKKKVKKSNLKKQKESTGDSDQYKKTKSKKR